MATRRKNDWALDPRMVKPRSNAAHTAAGSKPVIKEED